MTTIIAALEFQDCVYFAVIVLVFAVVNAFMKAVLDGRVGFAKRSYENVKLLTDQVRELQRKVDALLQHQGIEMPPPPASVMSPEVEQLARDPKTKIAAIQLFLEENPGTNLREATELINAICKSKK